MRPQSCTVHGPLALVLRIMRVLSLAPVTIARERGGYRIRVCKRYAYVGYYFIIFLNISHGFYVWLEFNLKSKYTMITEPLPLLWLLKLFDVSLGTIISGLGTLFSVTRMKDLIEQVYYMEQEIPANGRREENNKNKALILIMILFRLFLDVFNVIRNLFIIELGIATYGFCLSRIKYVLISAVQTYVFAIYEEILSKIRIVREEVQDLADLLEYECMPSSTGFTESANIRLRKIGEKIDFLSNLIEKMNQCNKYTAFYIYSSILIRLIQSAYDVSRISVEGLTLGLIFRFFFVLHHILSLVLFIEPFQGIELETQTIKLQVARMATTDYVTDSIPAPLDMLYDELSTMDMKFSPLGVFTIRRSLIVKTLGAAVSYLVVVFQFRVDKWKN